MTEKSLRLQILEYLIANNGVEEFVDIKTPFIDLLCDIKGRGMYTATIDKLVEDKHIQIGDLGYGIMVWLNAGSLRPLDEITIKAKLKPQGEYYLKDLVNPIPMSYTDNSKTINVFENKGTIQQGDNHRTSSHSSNKEAIQTKKIATHIQIIRFLFWLIGGIASAIAIYQLVTS